MRTLTLSLFASGMVMMGCGSLGDDGDRAPLAVLKGQLQQASTVAAPSAVRVAVVWSTNDTSAKYKGAIDIAATPVFPSQFQIELTDPPPAAAMSGTLNSDRQPDPTGDGPPSWKTQSLHPLDGPSSGYTVAVGTVVAYEDLNGNGTLDIVEEDATSYVDRVLGVNDELLLVYVEGTLSPELAVNGTQPVLGYNLLKKSRCTTAYRLGESGPPCDGGTDGWRPIASLYDLPLTAEPRFATVMCKGDLFGSLSESTESVPHNRPVEDLPPGPGPNGVWPNADDPNVTCISDGKGYEYRSCNTYSKGLCKGTVTDCHVTMWGYSTPNPPAEWPCSLQ